ncbi:MAG: hypothetical protein AAB276_09135, partial [Pseudomonadota bacterium]
MTMVVPARLIRLFIFGLVILAIPAGCFVFALQTPSRYVRIIKNDTKIDPLVTSVIVSSDKPGYSLVKIYGLGSRYKHVTYDFRNTTNGSTKHVIQTAYPVDLRGKDEVSLEIYLGTCRDGACTPDTHIANRWV